MVKIKDFLAELIEMVVISLLIIVPIRFFIIQPFSVRGQSMEPNFEENDYLVIDEISFRFRDPQRGEVVVLRSPQDQRQYYVKRVIGLPRETIEIKDYVVKIYSSSNPQGEILKESYLQTNEITEGNLKVTMKEGEYFVLGDNRRFSYDSRRWGLLERQEIIGRVWLRLWPPQSMKVFAVPNPTD
jgi:signal peptidase I